MKIRNITALTLLIGSLFSGIPLAAHAEQDDPDAPATETAPGTPVDSGSVVVAGGGGSGSAGGGGSSAGNGGGGDYLNDRYRLIFTNGVEEAFTLKDPRRDVRTVEDARQLLLTVTDYRPLGGYWKERYSGCDIDIFDNSSIVCTVDLD